MPLPEYLVGWVSLQGGGTLSHRFARRGAGGRCRSHSHDDRWGSDCSGNCDSSCGHRWSSCGTGYQRVVCESIFAAEPCRGWVGWSFVKEKGSLDVFLGNNVGAGLVPTNCWVEHFVEPVCDDVLGEPCWRVVTVFSRQPVHDVFECPGLDTLAYHNSLQSVAPISVHTDHDQEPFLHHLPTRSATQVPAGLSIPGKRPLEEACFISVIHLQVLKLLLLPQLPKLVDERFHSVNIGNSSSSVMALLTMPWSRLKHHSQPSLHLKSAWPRCSASRWAACWMSMPHTGTPSALSWMYHLKTTSSRFSCGRCLLRYSNSLSLPPLSKLFMAWISCG